MFHFQFIWGNDTHINSSQVKGTPFKALEVLVLKHSSKWQEVLDSNQHRIYRTGMFKDPKRKPRSFTQMFLQSKLMHRKTKTLKFQLNNIKKIKQLYAWYIYIHYITYIYIIFEYYIILLNITKSCRILEPELLSRSLIAAKAMLSRMDTNCNRIQNDVGNDSHRTFPGTLLS